MFVSLRRLKPSDDGLGSLAEYSKISVVGENSTAFSSGEFPPDAQFDQEFHTSGGCGKGQIRTSGRILKSHYWP